MTDISHMITCFLLFIQLADGFHSIDEQKSWKMWIEDHGHEIFGKKWRSDLSVGPPPQYHVADQDHFDGTNVNVWNQAYFVNDTFWKGNANAPVFLCVGGEGPPLDGSVVVASAHCNVAVEWLQETGGIMFAVEHRYYGCHNMSACPVKSFSSGTSDLKFLSSRQALGDLAQFHHHAVDKYHLKPTNKWVSFGGSYPGMLAGWFRLKYPHLVVASVSSSAPVLAQVDMKGYYDVTANAYTVDNNGVGGSQACHDAIASGHASIGTMFGTDAGRKQLASLFKLESADWLKDAAHQRRFAGSGVAYFPAQGNDPVCTRPACNIAKICVIMTNTAIGNEITRLAKLRATQTNVGILTINESTSLPDFWGYQTCTEFAFYQTCEIGSKCFFTQGLMTLDDEMSFCTSDFGIPSSKVYENVQFTNDNYGGLNSGGSHILSPNGEVDPWHALAILNSSNPERLPTLWVKGASHHAWTHPTLSTDQKSVIEARTLIKAQVAKWLQE